MAKKDLASLMNGIIGEKSSAKVPGIETENSHVARDVTDEMIENMEQNCKRNIGRPRKGETSSKSNEIRATFIVDSDLVRKVKYISLIKGKLLKDIINRALSDYVETWESANGKIHLPKKE
jgi:hypothetical protein